MKKIIIFMLLTSLTSVSAKTIVNENATYEGELSIQNERQGQSCFVKIGKITATAKGKDCYAYEVSSSIFDGIVQLHSNILRMDGQGSHCSNPYSTNGVINGEVSSKERVHLALDNGKLHLNVSKLKLMGTKVTRCENLKRTK